MKVLYLYKGGRRIKSEQVDFPKEFYYGFFEFKKRGIIVDFLEQEDIKDFRLSFFSLFLEFKEKILEKIGFSIPLLRGFYRIPFLEVMDRMNGYDWVIGTTDSIGLALAYYRRRNWLKARVIFIEMGLSGELLNFKKDHWLGFFLRKRVFNGLLKECELICLGEGSYHFLREELSLEEGKLNRVLFGVDTDFWKVRERGRVEGVILCIGNDRNRDFGVAIRVAELLKDDDFKFITMRDLGVLPGNVELRKGDMRSLTLSDAEVRELYYESLAVMVPLKETLQPSGQSVTLQAMSCGVPVIITRTGGFWAFGDFKDRKHIIFVKDTKSWLEAIKELRWSLKLREELSNEGSRLVREKYTVEDFSRGLLKVMGLGD